MISLGSGPIVGILSNSQESISEVKLRRDPQRCLYNILNDFSHHASGSCICLSVPAGTSGTPGEAFGDTVEGDYIFKKVTRKK